jgi:hypothetical protein
MGIKENLMSEDKNYEMFWDCESCGSEKLLGITHRHCPNCGAVQDSNARYFPSDDEKVALEDHEYTGADWYCPGCETPNASKAAFCTNCGTGKDGSKSVQIVDEPSTSEPKTQPSDEASKKGKGKKILKVVGGLVAAFVVFLLVFMFWTEEKGVTVDSHSWERSIAIEKYQRVKEGTWKEKVPLRGVVDRCYEKKQSTRKIEDGQTCTMKKKDNGDGSFREVEQCKTKYKEIPVMGQWCEYRIDKWKKSRDANATGDDLLPSWPTPTLNTCTMEKLGCEREGTKSQSYIVHFIDSDGDRHECDFKQKVWENANTGMTAKMEFRVMDGGIDCDTWKTK